MCFYGIVIGMAEDGGTWDASGEIVNTTFEAGTIAIWAYAASFMHIRTASILGQPYSPTAVYVFN
jgi:hypothetical protein